MGKRDIDNQINLLKLQICGCFNRYLKKNNLQQKTLARRMKLNRALLSKIVSGQYEEFTLDRLQKFLNKIEPDMVLVLKKISKAKKKKNKN